jgi:flagellar biosynthesis/type III secretory pathway protein FliH
MKTLGQRLIEQGRKKGRVEGRAKGVAEGLAKGRAEGLAGQREILLKLLRKRFGKLPDEVVSSVTSASSEKLGLWAERILSAKTIDEVFA